MKINTKIIKGIGLKLKKHSPDIFMVAGIIGTIGSTVLACKATLKVDEVISEKKEKMKAIEDCKKDSEIEYTEKDANKDTTIVYSQTAFKLIKLYAPAVGLGVLSLTALISSHNILKKRNMAIAAAYAVVDKGFKNYRENVVDRFGEVVDRELRYNIKQKEIESKIKDKNGKEKTKKEVVDVIEGDPLSNISEYARFFDECTSDQHKKDPEYNLMFLRRQQDYANEKLKADGYLFLNDVYSMLGIPKTKAGQVVGWIYDEKNPVGDNYVDFHIYDNKESNRLFVNGYEYSILLDFNVDGVIYDKI